MYRIEEFSAVVYVPFRDVTLAVVLGCASSGALAQVADTQAGRGPALLDEVTVTGEKVQRSVRETASSVVVVRPQDMKARADARKVDDMLRDIPNVVYNGSVGAPVIRGTDGQGSNSGSGAFFGGTVPRARINLDGHYLSYWESTFGGTSIWDVDSVEVFRGPQTSAQGANSIAGAIIVHTKDPTFQREGKAQLQAGNLKSRRASVMFSGPVLDNELAARVALDYSGRDTFIDYVNPRYSKGDTDTGLKDFNGHVKLLWTPSAVPGLESKFTVAHTRTNRPSTEAAAPPYDRLQNRTLTMPTFKSQAWTAVSDTRYDLDGMASINNQFQYTDGKTTRYSVPWTNGGANIDYRDISDELRLNLGHSRDQLSGVAGVFYDHVTSDDRLNVRGLSSFHDVKNSVGVFSEASWRFAPAWMLTGGLRYQYDSVKRTGTSSLARAALDFDHSYHAVLPKVALSYDFSPALTAGVMVNKGYNPGGTGLSFASGRFFEFAPETVINRELFMRMKALDDRLQINANVFHALHKDAQTVVPDYLNGVVFGNVVRNADRAKSYGAELGAAYEVSDSLKLRGSLGYLHTRINRFSSLDGQAFVGNRFGSSPRYTLSAGFDWNITDQVSLHADVRHSDGYFSSDENLAAYRVGGYTVGNVQGSWQLTRDWELYGYVDNMFDAKKPTLKYDDRTAGGIVASMLEPRTVGMGVRFSF